MIKKSIFYLCKFLSSLWAWTDDYIKQANSAELKCFKINRKLFLTAP